MAFKISASLRRLLACSAAIGIASGSADAAIAEGQSTELPKIASIDVGWSTGDIAFGFDSIWVTSGPQMGEPDRGLVWRIDPQSRRVLSTIRVGESPESIAVGFGSVWVAVTREHDKSVVSRIDPVTNTVIATMPVGNIAQHVAIGEGAVWVGGGGEISRIDPASGRIMASRQLRGPFCGIDALALADGALWLLEGRIGCPGPAVVLRVDLDLKETTHVITVGHYAVAMAVTAGAVWVLNAQPRQDTGTVSRIDTATNQVVATIPVGAYPSDIAAGGGAVWISGVDDTSVVGIDPATNSVARIIPVGRQSRRVVYGANSLWFTDFEYTVNALSSEDLRRVYPSRPELLPPPIAPVMTFEPDRPALSRPILYITTVGEGDSRTVKSAGVYADGRSAEGLSADIGATWSPDGRWFAAAQEGRRLDITSPSGRTMTVYEARSDEIIFPWPAWSPSGRDLAVIVTREGAGTAASDLLVIAVATRRVRRRVSLPAETVRLPFHFRLPDKLKWSPDERRVLVSWENAAVVDLVSSRIETISEGPVVAEWSPSGDGVYYFNVENRTILSDFYLRKLDSQNSILLVERPRLAEIGLKYGRAGARLALAPSGSRLALAAGSTKGGESALHIYDIKGGEALALDKPTYSFQSPDAVTAIEWAPGENSLAVLSAVARPRPKASVPPAPAPACCALKTVNIHTGQWNLLANVDVPQPDLLELKTLSWTR